MLLPGSIAAYEDIHPGSTAPAPGPVTLSDRVEHPQPIAATADHPHHMAYGVVLFIVLLVVLILMGKPALRWGRREGDVSSRSTSS